MRYLMYVLKSSFFLVFIACSCGGNSNKSNQILVETEETIIEAPEVVPNGDTVVVNLVSDDNMRFDKETIEVKQGDVVKLVLKHSGKMPKTAMGHNFVLLDGNISIEAFGTESASATESSSYIPEKYKRNVLAYTKMIGGGESTTILFLSPAQGVYNYLCSFPGHYGMMKGRFIVK